MSEFWEGEEGMDVYFHKGSGMAFSTRSEIKAQPTRLINRSRDNFNGEFIPNGEDNLYPQHVIEIVEKNDILPAVIDFKTRAVVSGGLMYGDKKYDKKTGAEIYAPKIIPEVEDFMEMIESDNYLYEAAADKNLHSNFYPEITLNVGRKATGLYCNDAAFTRLGVQTETGRNKGKISKVYVSADWADTVSVSDADVIDAVDPYYRVVQQLKEGKAHKYVIPSRAQSNGRLDYSRGLVDSLLASKWLDIDCSIPKWIERIMNGQLDVQYLIQVDESYWTDRWKDWENLTVAKQKTLKTGVYKRFTDFFKGLDSSGNILFTSFKREHKEEFSRWKITAMEGKKWDNGHIEQSTQSTAHIVTSQGVDNALIGMIPGKGFTAGSGSDKRVAFNQHVLLCQPMQRQILRPFDYIAELNGWNERYGKKGRRLRFWFKNTFIATLDHGKDTKPANDNNMKKT